MQYYFINFRTDRGRQLTHVLTQQDMPEEGYENPGFALHDHESVR